MLIKFSTKNFKKFKEELVYDLRKVRNYSFNEKSIQDKTINIALIYGSNGSGKSNLGFAIFDIINHLTDGEKLLSMYSEYLYGNGILDDKAEFKYEFKFGEDIIEYKYLKKNTHLAIREELTLNGKLVLKLDRESFEKEIHIKEAENLNLDNIFENKISILKYIFNNVLFEENSIYLKLKEFINSMLWFRSIQGNNYMGVINKTNKLSDCILETESIKKNINLSEIEKENKLKENLQEFENFLKENGINLQLKYKISNEGTMDIMVDVDGKLLDYFSIISSGTAALTNFYSWYKNIDKVKFLFIDEFDAFYHYKLSKKIIQKLKDKVNTQSILTTHSTNLMDNELLRPDCYFILKNNKISSLPDLTEKELREAHNLEKLFKAGNFDE